MKTLFHGPVLPVHDHALPFRVIFEELLRRRTEDVLKYASCLCPVADTTLPTAAMELNESALAEMEHEEEELRKLANGSLKEKRTEAFERLKEGGFAKLEAAPHAQESAYARVQVRQTLISEGRSRKTPDRQLKACDLADRPLKQILHKIDRSALCLSGGGIRSASFSLGILEGLARFSRDADGNHVGVLDGLDYLSTVSGGGYIGSWLMSWVWRRTLVKDKDWKQAYREVVSALAGQQNVSSAPGIPPPLPVTGGDPEPKAKRHLRSYTSFLAPALGATLDTATLGAILLRNLLVNWVMLVPALLAAVSAARAIGRALLFLQFRFEQSASHGWYWTEGICFLLAALIAAIELPSHDMQRSLDPANMTQWKRWSAVQKKLRPYAAGSFIVLVFLGAATLTMAQHRDPSPFAGSWTETVLACVGFAILSVSMGWAEWSRLDASRKARQSKAQDLTASAPASTAFRKFWLLFGVVVTPVMCGFLLSGLLHALRSSGFYNLLLVGGDIRRFHIPYLEGRLFIVLGLPVFTALLLVVTTLLCAFLGVFERDEDREWWVRCGGALMGLNVCWTVGQALVFYGQSAHNRIMTTLLGLSLAGLTSVAGWSTATAGSAAGASLSKLTGAGKFLYKHRLLLPALGLLSVFLISTGVVALEEILRQGPIGSLLSRVDERVLWLTAYAHAVSHLSVSRFILALLLGKHPDGGAALLLFLIAALLAVAINFAININLFSLQGIYRMRLMRAYLGASNVLRRPDPFTGFDPRDTPRMFEMPCTAGVPIHVLNCTLNLTGTTNNAWRQRRAEIFNFSPLVCGSWRTGYVRTEEYSSSHNGPTLAAAMSISGSAFNPNMGYQTSALLSVIMTFFAVRLGAWLPNPKRAAIKRWSNGKDLATIQRFFHRAGPLFALGPLWQELLGGANDTRRFVELTDGGHFEDLALYDMVMRRVKTIILVDAGADPDYQFEDLGNAVRKIQIDLGVSIDFEDAMPMRKGMEGSNLYCAVGTIRYGCVDQKPGCSGEQFDGKLLYIKPVLTGGEPADIFQYRSTHAAFPHETTINQFFNESQFESYRHLGSYIVDRIVKAPMPVAKRPSNYGSLQSLFHFATRFGRSRQQAAPKAPVSSAKE